MAVLRDTHLFYFNLKALPSQRQGLKQILYDVWVIVNKDGWILTGDCTCMAGLGSVCSHVAALLFKIDACIRLELYKVSSTSKLCQWKKSRRQVDPAPLLNIKFQQPKMNKDLPRRESEKICPEKNFATKNVDIPQLNLLKNLSKDAAIFTSVVEIKSADTSETDSASEDETSSLPEPLTYMFDPHAVNYSKDDLKEVSTKVFKQYVLENNQGRI